MIDKKRALEDFQITEKEYDELLVEFIAQAEEKVAGIEQCLRDGKVEEAERQAHSLKGVAGNLRLDDCYRVAVTIDGALKKIPPLPVEDSLMELKKAIDDVRKSITCL
jgi:two-component system, sensor histidine kinase and response regulator